MKFIVFGGTGTLGRAMVNRLLGKKITSQDQITIFSRGELEQQKMKTEYPFMNYVIGDIRDRYAVKAAMRHHETVFHFAAMKHIDIAETNPIEAIKTNVDGTRNIVEAAEECGAIHMVFSSTDKAVLPINVYGMTKAISEKYLLELNKKSPLNITVFRWGNVVGSRGSAIRLFAERIARGEPVPLTDVNMTRFWIKIDDAADFVIKNYQNEAHETLIPQMKAASILRVADALGKILEKPVEYAKIGIRPGEKIHECLHSSHQFCLNSNTCAQYSDDELSRLLRPIIQEVVG